MEAKMMKMKNDKKRRNEKYRQKSKEEKLQGSKKKIFTIRATEMQ